jgi:hypothetical protein
VIDRGDRTTPGTQLPILDGGFDQKQIIFGITRHIDRGTSRRGDGDNFDDSEDARLGRLWWVVFYPVMSCRLPGKFPSARPHPAGLIGRGTVAAVAWVGSTVVIDLVGDRLDSRIRACELWHSGNGRTAYRRQGHGSRG